jgi:hypothetical protein
MSKLRSGGCLCGAVRYEAKWPPLAVAVCHCKNCQKQAGSALSVIAILPRDGLSISGDLRTYRDQADSGRAVYRKFCGDCGSPVVTDTPEAQAQGMIFLKAGTLDETQDLKPTQQYWTRSAQRWLSLTGGGPCLDTQ